MTDKRDGSTLADQLTKLTDLRNSGAITESEFETAKRRILGMSGMAAASTLPGRAAVPDLADPDQAPPPTAAGVAASVDLGPLPTTEVLPDIPAGGFTLGGLHGEDDGQPAVLSGPMRPQPDSMAGSEIQLVPEEDSQSEEGLSLEWKPAQAPNPQTQQIGEPGPMAPSGGDPPDLGVADLLGEVPPTDTAMPPSQPAAPPHGMAPGGPPPGMAPGGPPPGMAPGGPPPGMAPGGPPPGGPPPAVHPTVPPGYMYTDTGAAERRAVMDLGGSVSRTAWMIGGGLLALVLLLLLLSSGFRVWFGGAMFVLGALLTIGGSIWLLVEAARTSVLWLVLFLFVPFANLAFVIVHWSTAKRPFITELVGVGMLILGAVLFAAGISGSRKRCDSEKFDSRGRGAPGRISKSSRVNDDVDEPRVRPRRRPVRWRAVGGFSCAGVQDRIDDCEDEWVDQLERMLKRRSYPPGVMRISVDRPQTAVKQAQTLAFDSGELHRCQVAQRRQLPIESEWLKGLGGCFARKQCKAFSACHTKVFLRYVGQLPFSCRFYCNKELYQCAAEVVGSTLADQRGYKGVPDEDRLDRVRPKLFARCLRFCKKKIKTHKTREAMVQCVFQPTCKAFVECVKPIPMD